jgi:hypothetical protein
MDSNERAKTKYSGHLRADLFSAIFAMSTTTGIIAANDPPTNASAVGNARRESVEYRTVA